ncbi:30S ribosomal protein S15 [Candidatus Gromoviella agglomerans]|uniref:30S ribosomal protein S15 n=1 Tax=Candidatus Gromoviella agglomerans TaxID=2806609 RepID=UPI001E57A244|nr:30S ribosomal protein S15 [Candidatus Gromoviella agglomerans]UFX98614.1 30S ribosomal protein S15 [Candidatus Gromoviella agglomerans]
MVSCTQWKVDVISSFKLSEFDTGSPEVQIAIFTKEIKDLTAHLSVHKKDNHSMYGLVKKVSKRRRLLKYLKRERFDSYTNLIKKLGIRN